MLRVGRCAGKYNGWPISCEHIPLHDDYQYDNKTSGIKSSSNRWTTHFARERYYGNRQSGNQQQQGRSQHHGIDPGRRHFIRFFTGADHVSDQEGWRQSMAHHREQGSPEFSDHHSPRLHCRQRAQRLNHRTFYFSPGFSLQSGFLHHRRAEIE